MRVFALAILSTLLISFSGIAQEYQLGKPVVHVKGGQLFERSTQVSIDFRLANSVVRYTTDGTEPSSISRRYQKSIRVNKTGLLKVKAFKEGYTPSETVAVQFVKLGHKIKSIEVQPTPSKSYPGEGRVTLIDREAGSQNFRDGKWLGYNKGPVVIIVDLGKNRVVNEILLSTLTSPGSWIMPPTSIRSQLSVDGIRFEERQTLKIKPLSENASGERAAYTLNNFKGRARYIKLTIHSLESLPEWHPGKGNSAWLFLDEIIVR